MSTTELLRVAETLRIVRSVKEWRSKSAQVETSLNLLFDMLSPNKYLEEKLAIKPVTKQMLGNVMTLKKAKDKSFYNEVKSTYYDQSDKAWYVESWLTDDEEEEGRTVAKIHDNGDVEYTAKDAQQLKLDMNDLYIQYVINQKLREMKSV